MANWEQVGDFLEIITGDFAFEPAISTLSDSRVAYIDGSWDEFRTYEFDGNDWNQIGPGNAIAAVNPDVAAITSNLVAYIQQTFNRLHAMSFDGTNWTSAGFLSVSIIVSGKNFRIMPCKGQADGR
jgi:hypothetical protein